VKPPNVIDSIPQGPVIRFLSEKAQVFVGKKVKKATAIDDTLKLKQLEGQKVREITTFGKQLLITLADISVSIHLMLFGYYRINEKKKDGKLRLGLEFDKGEITSMPRRSNWLKNL